MTTPMSRRERYATTDAPRVDTANFRFYDIESLHNIFTAVFYDSHYQRLNLYYLIDDEKLNHDVHVTMNDPEGITRISRHIITENPALAAQWGDNPPNIAFYNLRDITTQGLMWNNWTTLFYDFGGFYIPTQDYEQHHVHDTIASGNPLRDRLRIITDTHEEYSPNTVHPFIVGYNSLNYDMPMMAYIISVLTSNTHNTPHPYDLDSYVTAEDIRVCSDQIIGAPRGEYVATTLENHGNTTTKNIYQALRNSGRHLDISRLNERQSRVGLKRMLAQMGHQVKESDRLSDHNAVVENVDDVIDLITYNVSDVIGTMLLFQEPAYSTSFDLRSSLLRTYPEVVFDNDNRDWRTPSDTTVHRGRLGVDSSSAQFAARILAPYRGLHTIPNHCADNPVVSFRYPAPDVARDKGIERFNTITRARDFFFDNITDPHAREQFREVYEFYRDIEGRNFNTNNTLTQLYNLCATVRTTLAALPWDNATDHATATALCALLPAQAPQRGRATYAQWRTHLAHLADLAQRVPVVGGNTTQQRQRSEQLRYAVDYLTRYTDACADAQIPYDDPHFRIDEVVVEVPNDRSFSTGDDINKSSLDINDVAKRPTNIPYFTNARGDVSTCFATFSTGGIHGQEINMEHYRRDNEESLLKWRDFLDTIDHVVAVMDAHADDDLVKSARAYARSSDNDVSFSDMPEGMVCAHSPETIRAAAYFFRHKIRLVTDSGEIHHKDYLKSGPKSHPEWKRRPLNVKKASRLFNPEKTSKKPLVPEGSTHRATKFNKSYAMTSINEVIHEDFTSYYPLMLTNMQAFANPDLASGEDVHDRYVEIFHQKEKFGKLMKDKSLSAPERERYKVRREGVKLILNAASGAADAKHDTNIRMNNTIIAMRVNGQIFSWLIGQAQTLAGGAIPSTNTDGLYSTLDWDNNQKILDEFAPLIGVQIEPESLILVSKDSNNRAEFAIGEVDNPLDRTVYGASGGSLSAWRGPHPFGSLDHSAIIDRTIVDYFRHMITDLDTAQRMCREPFDRAIGRKIMHALHETHSVQEMLLFYQNIVAGSPSSHTYPYATPIVANDAGGTHSAVSEFFFSTENFPTDRGPSALQRYVRTFIVSPDKVAQRTHLPKPVHIAMVKAKTVSAQEKERMQRRGTNNVNGDANPYHVELFTQCGGDFAAVRNDRRITVEVATGVSPTAPLMIFSGSIHHCPDERVLYELLECIDTDAYLDIIEDKFNTIWLNKS